MKTYILISFTIIIFLAVLLLFLYNTVPGIAVYGLADAFIIDSSGNLIELTGQKSNHSIKEMIIKGNNNRCLVISRDDIEDYRIQRSFNGWDLADSNNELIIRKIKSIYLESGREDFGIYHLSYTDEISFFSSYEHLKSLISFDDNREVSGTLSPLSCFHIEGVKADSVLFIFSNGKEEWRTAGEDGSLTLCPAFLFPDLRLSGGSSLKVVWENPPPRSALQIHKLLMDAVAEAPTMAIFIDGLGYKMWHYAQENGYTESFPEIDIKPMRAVYPPKTVYNYYAFGTGRTLPGRSEREEIFAGLAQTDKKGVILEGQMQIYPSPLQQILHLPEQNEGDVDYRIFNSVMNRIGDYDFIFVHFHDIDNNGHRYGAYSDKTMARVRDTGTYLSRITDKWEGNLFVFSDHGMHTYYDEITGEYGGTHYTGKAEDIISIFATKQ